MDLRLYDAHNHLQDERLAFTLDQILRTVNEEPIVKMVVNGSCEKDWPAVLALAERSSRVIPSFGYHPWHLKERTAAWQDRLTHFLDRVPSAVGEIGLDRWSKDYDLDVQESAGKWQALLAARRGRPVID